MDLKVEARNVELRKGWQERVEEEKEKLIRNFAAYLLHLRVVIEATTHHKEGGFEIKLVASVPNDIVVVTRKGGAVRPLLVEAFDVLSLQLKENIRKKHQNKKGAETLTDSDSFGTIRKLSPHESYGFIVTTDERDVYFHENALKNIEMEQLSEGDGVFYGETFGDKGPQASWVRLAK